MATLLNSLLFVLFRSYPTAVANVMIIIITRRVPVQRAADVERDEIPYP